MSLKIKLKQLSNSIIVKIDPQVKQLQKRWDQLVPRERYLLVLMTICLIITLLYFVISGMIGYQKKLAIEVTDLNKMVLYSEQAKYQVKKLSKAEINKFNQVTTEQIKSDITQVVQIESPVILLQDEQLTIDLPNAKFALVATLFDQLRRSYGIYPDQVNIVKQSQSGYVNVNAIFWVSK